MIFSYSRDYRRHDMDHSSSKKTQAHCELRTEEAMERRCRLTEAIEWALVGIADDNGNCTPSFTKG
jgi:hypothetical protein